MVPKQERSERCVDVVQRGGAEAGPARRGRTDAHCCLGCSFQPASTIDQRASPNGRWKIVARAPPLASSPRNPALSFFVPWLLLRQVVFYVFYELLLTDGPIHVFGPEEAMIGSQSCNKTRAAAAERPERSRQQ